MARFIDIRSDEPLPTDLTLDVGDLVRISATGGRVRSGTAVEILGVFSDSVVGTDGSVLTPLGAPNVVLVQALATGDAVVEIFTGDPFQAPVPGNVLSPVTHRVAVRVEPVAGPG
jgi:hypothetical protein